MTAVGSLLARIRGEARRFGTAPALYDLTIRVLNRLVYFRLLKALRIETARPEALARLPDYRYGFLTPGEVAAFARDPACEMTPAFLAEVGRKGDECYGIVHGATLASYGWYSRQPTMVEDDLVLSFEAGCHYMYKGFTHQAYRGQRLHAAGMALALEDYRARGAQGLVTYVDSHNYASLQSCARMGYVTFGRVAVLRAFGRYFIRSSPGCRARGFVVAATGPSAA